MNSEKSQVSRKKIKTAIISVCASIVLLGTTTFAWFTLTNQARVGELTLKAGTAGGLLIGNTAQTVSTDPLLLTSKNGNTSYCVRPITSVDGKSFYKPIYNTDGIVTDIEGNPTTISTIANKTEKDGGYILSYTFFLKAESNSITHDVGIKLASNQAVANGIGTSIKQAAGNTAGAETAMRMSFTVGNTTTVYEPNADSSVATNTTQEQMSGWTSLQTIKQTSANTGLFAATPALPGASVTYNSTTSPELFKIPINTATEVTLNIWLEGADEDCVNEIAADDMLANIVFVCTDLD